MRADSVVKRPPCETCEIEIGRCIILGRTDIRDDSVPRQVRELRAVLDAIDARRRELVVKVEVGLFQETR